MNRVICIITCECILRPYVQTLESITGEPKRNANLLDGDLASNHLSWQWVAGTFSNRKYVANQENINKYFNGNQRNTFLDVSYEAFANLKVPALANESFKMEVEYPASVHIESLENKKTLIYNYYNLDPYWHKGEDFQRILLIEPSVFNRHPISQKCMDFAVSLSENIEGIQIVVGEFFFPKSAHRRTTRNIQRTPAESSLQGSGKIENG